MSSTPVATAPATELYHTLKGMNNLISATKNAYYENQEKLQELIGYVLQQPSFSKHDLDTIHKLTQLTMTEGETPYAFRERIAEHVKTAIISPMEAQKAMFIQQLDIAQPIALELISLLGATIVRYEDDSVRHVELGPSKYTDVRRYDDNKKSDLVDAALWLYGQSQRRW
jgi:hypothetical protein